MIDIYLAGYGTGNKASTLLRRAEDLNALVADVRAVAWSQREEWQYRNLKEIFYPRYLNLALWGNRNYKHEDRHKGIEIINFEDGLYWFQRRLMKGEYSAAILLCGCRSEIGCHRGELGKRLRTLGYTVRPLEWRPKKAKPPIQPALMMEDCT